MMTTREGASVFKLTLALLLVGYVAAGAAPPAPLDLTDAAPETIELTTGEAVTLTATMAGGTGYQWKIVVADENVATVGEPETDGTSMSGMVGGPVRYTWTLTAKAAGQTTLTAQLVRSWQPDKPAKKHEVKIIVK
jgi:predicted secreted protein